VITLQELDDIFARRAPPPDGVTVLDDSCYTPSSNTGCTSIIDYLSVTTLILAFPQFKHSELGLANKMFDRVFPDASILATDFSEKGLFGYRYSADLFAPECDQPCGKIAYGGNGNTLLISISGSGCPFIGSPERIKQNLIELDSKITRVDLAFDDFTGEYIDMEFLSYLASTNFFTSDNGKKPKRIKYDDLNSLAGKTITIGRSGDRELTFYEKGLQLQDYRSAWKRCEVRLWSKNKKIPFDVLVNGGAYMRGAYPQLTSILPVHGSRRCQSFRAQSKATIEAEDKFIFTTVGRALRLRKEELSSDEFQEYISKHLVKSGMPRRWKTSPESVVKKLINENKNRETNHVS